MLREITLHTAWTTYVVQGPAKAVRKLEAIGAPYFLTSPEIVEAATWTLLLEPNEHDGPVESDAPVEVALNLSGKAMMLRGSQRWLAVHCLRHMRAIDRTEAVRRGALSLHGACVARDDRAIALVGPSRCGKTTAALSIARSINAAMLANDDIVLTGDHNGWTAQGLARSTGIRVDSLRDHWPSVSKEALLGTPNLHPRPPGEKVFLVPRELGRIGVRCTPFKVSLVAVVALEVGSAGAALSRVRGADAEALVEPWIDHTPDRFRPHFAAALGVASVPRRADAINRLCRDLPIHRYVHAPTGWAEDVVGKCQELLA